MLDVGSPCHLVTLSPCHPLTPSSLAVILLFNEGEEDGLLGAEAFTSTHPWAQQVGAVVNLEARGTTGASLMFETSDASGWIIDLFARSTVEGVFEIFWTPDR